MCACAMNAHCKQDFALNKNCAVLLTGNKVYIERGMSKKQKKTHPVFFKTNIPV